MEAEEIRQYCLVGRVTRTLFSNFWSLSHEQNPLELCALRRPFAGINSGIDRSFLRFGLSIFNQKSKS
jgi:hypothetical protein